MIARPTPTPSPCRRCAALPRRARSWLCLLAVLAVLAGCATATGPQGKTRDPARSAQLAYELGQYDLALQDFLALAQRQPEQASGWRLRAADSAFLMGDENRAVDLLAQLDRQQLSPGERRFANLLSLLAGEINPASIGVRLAMLGRPETWPAPYRPLVHRLRGRALAQNGQAYRAAQELVAFGQTVTDPQTAAENRAEILRTLTPLSARRALDLLGQHQPEDEMYGWLALVADIKNSLFAGPGRRGDPTSRADLAETLAAWRLRFPRHPAAADSLETLLGGAPVQTATPDRIAVLLPFSGRFPAAAGAVRDGLLSAYFDDDRRRAQIQFYDTGSTPETAVSMYRRAIDDGADQIIGPLERDAVTAVLLEADGSTPVLALNHQGSAAPPAPGNLQFGLLPEEEARSIARHMINDGLLRVAVMAAADAWGQRVSNAFIDHFDRLGGVVLDVQQFQPLAQDFGAQVSALVGTTSAELRRRQIARAFGFPVGFEADPRHDLDAVFLAAQPCSVRITTSSIPVFEKRRSCVMVLGLPLSAWIFERMSHPVNAGSCGLATERHHVKAAGGLGESRVTLQKMACHASHAKLFPTVYGPESAAKVRPPAVADFDKHQGLAVAHDQVEFTHGTAVVLPH